MTTTYLAYIPSPPQGVWHLGIVPIRAYALFIIVGIIVALVLGDRRWVARGGQPGVIYDIAIPAVLFGLIGGRLYHVITDWRTYFGDDGAGLTGALRIWDGGLGIWGAVALGGVGAWIGCRRKGIPLPAFGDAIAPGIVLAQAIGRLGNYFNQELYGRPTTLPWGLEIYERRDASGALDTLNGVSTGQLIEVVHPTFLYELLWNLLVFAALIYIDRRFKIGHGRLFAMYVAGYCLGRFWIELMRSDVAAMPIDGIRVNTFTSTFVFIGAVVYIMVAPKGREDPASLAGKPEKVEDEEDTVEAFAKELTAVAATTGVVAAAKAAGDAEDEDAKAAVEDAKDEKAEEPEEPEAEEPETEAAEDAEEESGEEKPNPGRTEAGLGAVEGEEAVEARRLRPRFMKRRRSRRRGGRRGRSRRSRGAEARLRRSRRRPEAESDEKPQAEAAEPEAGLGAVEGEEAVEALEAAPEVHEAAVEAIDEAEALVDEVAAEDEAAEAAEPEAEAEDASAEEPAAEPDEEPQAEPEGEVEAADEAEAESDDDSEPDEPETEAAEAAVEEAAAEPSEEEAAEEAEAVVEEADAAADEEPETGVLEQAELQATAGEPEPAEESGGRLSRWLRRNR